MIKSKTLLFAILGVSCLISLVNVIVTMSVPEQLSGFTTIFSVIMIISALCVSCDFYVNFKNNKQKDEWWGK